MKNTIKKAIKPALVFAPFAAVGGYFTGRYLFDSLGADMQQMVVEQLGSADAYALITMVQSAMYALVCTIIGYILAEKTGLLKSFGLKKDALEKSAIAATICGIVFSLDYWVFGKIIPQVATSYESEITIKSVDNWISSVFYGGIVEELLIRFFLMSFVVFIIWKIFFKNCTKEEIPVKVFMIANVLCALVFAAGHLPATISMFGELTFLIVFRCFVLNGAFGVVYGELYRKFGIQYAIVGHMITHIVSKLIWLIFV